MEENFPGVRVIQSSLNLTVLQFWHKQGAGTNEVVSTKTKKSFVLFKRRTLKNVVPCIVKWKIYVQPFRFWQSFVFNVVHVDLCLTKKGQIVTVNNEICIKIFDIISKNTKSFNRWFGEILPTHISL